MSDDIETASDKSGNRPRKEGSNRIKRWEMYCEITEVGAISRRYFVMNAFDGALTMLGVVIGASLAEIDNPMFIILTGFATAFAMAMSGLSGAYMAESAERLRELKSLEKAMLSNMDDTIHELASRFATYLTAVVDGVSPALAALIVISPFFFVNTGLVSMEMAFIVSVTLTMIVLLVLGMYLARMNDQSIIRHGLRMLIVGLVTALLIAGSAVLLGVNPA